MCGFVDTTDLKLLFENQWLLVCRNIKVLVSYVTTMALEMNSRLYAFQDLTIFPSGNINSLIVADVYCAGDRDGLAIGAVRKYALSTN